MYSAKTEIYLCFQNMLLNFMLKRSCAHIWRCCCEKRNATEGDCKEYRKREKDHSHIGTAELYVETGYPFSIVEQFHQKGGFLIDFMISLSFQTTKDLDAIIIGYPVSTESVWRMSEEISNDTTEQQLADCLFAGEKTISLTMLWRSLNMMPRKLRSKRLWKSCGE